MRSPMNNTEREECEAQDGKDRRDFPSGNTGIDLLQRAAYAARELGPLPDKVDAAIGMLGLIAVRLMSKPLPDSALDLEMLAKMVRE